MANLLWPGDVRAGDLFSDETFLAAMVAVEEAWLDALAASGIAPATVAKLDLQSMVKPFHREWLDNEAEATGNPAAALVELLRDGLKDQNAHGARWLHRGLTSQDVVDTALMLCAGDAIDEVVSELGDQIAQPGRAGRAPPPDADGRPYPHPARRAHDVRPEGGGLADRRPRRVRRRRGARPPGAGRWRRRHPGRDRRARGRPRRPGRRGHRAVARAGHRARA